MDDSQLSLAGSVTANSAKEFCSVTPSGELQQAGTAPEIVAAIAAAVSSYLNMSASKFAISSVISVPSHCSSSFWTIAGRQRLMEQRQDLASLRRRKN